MNPFQFFLVLEASALAASLAAMKQHVEDGDMEMVKKFYTKAKLNKLAPHFGTVVQHELELLNLQNEPDDDPGRDRSRSPPRVRDRQPPKLPVLKKARPEY